MEKGWVKLYRKSKENLLMRDANAWMVFSWIMLTVNRVTGEMTLGRFWASEYFGLKSGTFYKILKRLEKKYKVVTLTSNNKYTTVSLLNWDKYQYHEDLVTQESNNKVTTKEQQSNTYTRSKELRIEKRGVFKKTYNPLEEFEKNLNRDLEEDRKRSSNGKLTPISNIIMERDELLDEVPF